MTNYYIKRPIPIEAVQWDEYGDHPEVELYSWKFREAFCGQCDKSYLHHGWLNTPEGKMIVCPSDYIIKGLKGEHYPCKEDIFHKTYLQLKDGDMVECDYCNGKRTTSGTAPCCDCGGTGFKEWDTP